jgi:hypothetical protein
MSEEAKILHIVLFRTAGGVTEERREQVCAMFHACREECEGVEWVAAGPNVSPSPSAAGWDLAVVMQFSGVGARDAFLPHPAHRRIGEATAAGFFEQLVVFDLPFAPAGPGGT